MSNHAGYYEVARVVGTGNAGLGPNVICYGFNVIGSGGDCYIATGNSIDERIAGITREGTVILENGVFCPNDIYAEVPSGQVFIYYRRLGVTGP